jgi:DNA-binding GntR family transcriptional regulator
MLDKNESTPTLSDKIYTYLKESIIKYRIRPNQRINEKEIAAQFDSSTTPVREAVLRLSAEGFIEISPYRHAVVKEISSKELEEMYEVITILDYHALKAALDELTEENLLEIAALTEELERWCHVDSLEKYLELNALIHTKIWKVIKNKFLYSTLYQVYNQVQRYAYARYAVFLRHGALKKSLRKHQKLLETIRTKNSSALKKLVRDHWKV